MTTMEESVTTTIERLPTGAELAAIADPEQRLAASGEVAVLADERAEPYRLRRNAAAIELFRTSGQPAARVWHDILDISRTMWGRILEQVHPDYIPGLRAQLAEFERRGKGREAATVQRKIERAEHLLAAIEELRAELDGAGLTTDGPTAKARVERLTEIARTVTAAVRELDELGGEAQAVRNDTARGLMDRRWGYTLRNAEVARKAQLTTARVAQLRTSY